MAGEFDPEQPRRRSTRLKGYDYRQGGMYFVTLCAYGRMCLLGEVVNGEMRVSAFGEIARGEWFRSADLRPEIILDEFGLMPNHIHGVVCIRNTGGTAGVPNLVGAHGRAPLRRPPRSLGSFIAGYKSAVTQRINFLRGTPGEPVWQRNYYEHIVRDEAGLNRIRQYILENPARWAEDRENPNNPCGGATPPRPKDPRGPSR